MLRYLPRIEIALLPHHVFNEGRLTLVDEEQQFAGIRKVDLRASRLMLAIRSSWSRAVARLRWSVALRAHCVRRHIAAARTAPRAPAVR